MAPSLEMPLKVGNSGAVYLWCGDVPSSGQVTHLLDAVLAMRSYGILLPVNKNWITQCYHGPA